MGGKTGYPISFYTLKILYLVIDRKKILFLANNLVYILLVLQIYI